MKTEDSRNLTKLSDIEVSISDQKQELISLIEQNFANANYVIIPENKTAEGLITKPVIEMKIKKDFSRLVIKHVISIYIVSNKWNDVEARSEFIVNTDNLSKNKIIANIQLFWRKFRFIGNDGISIAFYY